MATDNLMQKNSQNTQAFVVPSIEDFEKLSAEDLQSNGEVLVLKHKLVMREGEHNGVYYSWEELKRALATGEGGGLYYDHDDAASNWVGDVKNLFADDAQKCIFGDLHIVDPIAAKKLRYGAKWGVSPTIDAEKIVRDGQRLALDPKFLSFSLVLRPAVRETMLNSENRVKKEVKSMENNKEIEELAQKNKTDMDAKDVKHKEELEAEKAKTGALNSKVEEYEAKELEKNSAAVLELGSKYGMLNEEDLSEIKELSDKGRAFVSKVMGRVAKILKLDEDKPDEKTEEEKAEEEKKEDLSKKDKPQERVKEELSAKEASQEKISKGMFEYMQEKQNQ